MVTTRHELLAELHRIVKPMVYLEVGVQYGHSLALANECPYAYGIDPNPQLTVPVTGKVLRSTSDDFFASDEAKGIGTIDLAFIDGMHLVEFALHDFMNIEKKMDPWGVIVFDDVLPRNYGEASRNQCPGDWAGDVWKIREILYRYRPELSLHLVDVQPTGLLIVTSLNYSSMVLSRSYEKIVRAFASEHLSFDQAKLDDVLSRKYALTPDAALNLVQQLRTFTG